MSKPTDDTLRDWIKYCSLSENPDYEMVIIAAKELLELRERTRWIPVTEKLPDDDIECLVYDKGLSIFMSMISEGVWYTDGYAVDVTHWQHLPEPPEVKG